MTNVPNTLKKPNGERVTMRDLKEALYEKDVLDAKRYGFVMDSINGLHDRINGHEDKHNREDKAEDNKEFAKQWGFAALGGACVGVIAAVLRAMSV